MGCDGEDGVEGACDLPHPILQSLPHRRLTDIHEDVTFMTILAC